MRNPPPTAGYPFRNGSIGESLRAQFAALSFQFGRHFGGTLGAGLARQQGMCAPVLSQAAKTAQGHRVNLKGGGDLMIWEGQHFCQLSDQYPLDGLVIAGITSSGIAIENNGALVMGIDHLHTW